MAEADLLRGVLQALTLRKVLCWRVNSGNLVVGKGEDRYVVRGAPAGSPDVMCVIGDGRLCALELKTQDGKQRATQKRWQARAEKHGVRYGIARSIGEALALVDRWTLETRP